MLLLPRSGRSAAAALAVATVLTGCSGSAHEQAAREVARDFYAAVGAADGAAACALLHRSTTEELERSSGEPCAAAVLSEVDAEVGDARRVQVFGTMAQVRFARDTTFLTADGEGWRVLAAACTGHPDEPHDCRVEGP